MKIPCWVCSRKIEPYFSKSRPHCVPPKLRRPFVLRRRSRRHSLSLLAKGSRAPKGAGCQRAPDGRETSRPIRRLRGVLSIPCDRGMPRLSALHHGFFRTPVQALRCDTFTVTNCFAIVQCRIRQRAPRGRALLPGGWFPGPPECVTAATPAGAVPVSAFRMPPEGAPCRAGMHNKNIEKRNDQERRLCMLVRVCARPSHLTGLLFQTTTGTVFSSSPIAVADRLC